MPERARESHPPPPGPVLKPNFLPVMEALGDVTFPISKREVLDTLGEGVTVIFDGRNVELHEILKDIPDDYFESESELIDSLERQYMPLGDERVEAGALPTGPQESWQSRVGPGDSASAKSIFEPQE